MQGDGYHPSSVTVQAWMRAIALVFFSLSLSCSRFVCVCNDEETASRSNLARFSQVSWTLPLTARVAVIIIYPVGTIWKGYFHLQKDVWVGFLLALGEKRFRDRLCQGGHVIRKKKKIKKKKLLHRIIFFSFNSTHYRITFVIWHQLNVFYWHSFTISLWHFWGKNSSSSPSLELWKADKLQLGLENGTTTSNSTITQRKLGLIGLESVDNP